MNNHFYYQPLPNQDFIRYMLNCHHLHDHKSDIGKRFLDVDTGQDECNPLDYGNIDFKALLNPSMTMLKPMQTKLPRSRISKVTQGNDWKRKRYETNFLQEPHHLDQDNSQHDINMSAHLRSVDLNQLTDHSSADRELRSRLSEKSSSSHDDDNCNTWIHNNDNYQSYQHHVNTSHDQQNPHNNLTGNDVDTGYKWTYLNDDSSKKQSIQLNTLSTFKKSHPELCRKSKWTLYMYKQGWMPLISDIDWISDQYMAYCLLALLYGHHQNDTFYINSTKLIGFVSLVDMSLKMIPNHTSQAQNTSLIKFLQDQDNKSQNQPLALSITSPGFGIQLPDRLKQTIMQACKFSRFPGWYSRVVYVDAFHQLDNGTPQMEVFDLSHHQVKVANFQLESSNNS